MKHPSPLFSLLIVISALASTHAMAVPTPCNSSSLPFLNPVYALPNWTLTRTHHNQAFLFPVTISLSAILTDTANNYSLLCTAEHNMSTGEVVDGVFASCTRRVESADDDEIPHRVELVVMDTEFFPKSESDTEWPFSVGVQQAWYCGPREEGGGKRWYNVYQAHAYFETRISCPQRWNTVGEVLKCSVMSSPGKAARLTVTKRPNDFPQPVRRSLI
ncbi:hypothetical protein QBC34DRAFT_409901 [Podospora aff. communis PSN243]|uniref:AA1-like domain-containing protein n=1 Tax=Podospora aff. communis PSN243 TaxID=3040156 RepID=A0AAV9GH03_9PEZI|nr:hypothetical protein QBC34DRAFT_409901 [Podospora aff. communis PSN243]